MTQSIVTEACRFHRTPASSYAGFNTRLRGAPLPARLRPAPLNLILRSLETDGVGQADIAIGTYAFLDFDAC